MNVTSKAPRGTKWIGTQGWVHVNRKELLADPPSLLHSVIGPNEIHLYHSRDHARNFLDCVRSRGLTITPAEVAHRSISIGHLGIIAMKVGRKLRWNPQKERFLNDPQADKFLSRAMRNPWRL